MLTTNYQRALLALSIAILPVVNSAFTDALPKCIRDCIDSSNSEGCSGGDLKCLCRASQGNFLPDFVSCIHDECDDYLSADLLLSPLQFACVLAGTPIPEDAIKSAEGEESSLNQVTKTIILSPTEASLSTATVTTTDDGETYTLAYPVTIKETTTLSGDPSTITATSSSSQAAVSTYTTTNDDGETTTSESTVADSQSSSTTSSDSSEFTESTESTQTTTESSSTLTTTVAAGQTTSSESTSSSTSTAPPASDTNSAPFTDTNAATSLRLENWAGLGVLFAVACAWF